MNSHRNVFCSEFGGVRFFLVVNTTPPEWLSITDLRVSGGLSGLLNQHIVERSQMLSYATGSLSSPDSLPQFIPK